MNITTNMLHELANQFELMRLMVSGSTESRDAIAHAMNWQATESLANAIALIFEQNVIDRGCESQRDIAELTGMPKACLEAIALKDRDPYDYPYGDRVPMLVQLSQNVLPELPFMAKGIRGCVNHTYFCKVNRYGAVTILIPVDDRWEELGVKPAEFRVMAYHPERRVQGINPVRDAH